MKGTDDSDTYAEYTTRRAPKWAFLGWGSVPPGLIEDGLAVVLAEPNGTCKTSSR
jgi:hypothetical protein